MSADDDATLIKVAGDLDMALAPVLRATVVPLLNGGVVKVVVDLASVEFLDSSGLSALIGTHNRLRERHGELRLRSVPAQAARILRTTGLDRVFAVEDPAGDVDG